MQDMAGQLVTRQMRLESGTHLLGQPLTICDDGHANFAPAGIGDTDHGALRSRCVRNDGLLNLSGIHVLTA